jgi:4-hydroxythreonine-4-phosphate dehydrogenase
LTTIGITLGDPAGIGPEVVRAALAAIALPPNFQIKIFGDETGHVPGFPTPASAGAAFDALEAAAKSALNGEIQAVVTGPVSKHPMHAIGFDFPGQTEFFADRWKTPDYAMCLTGGGLTVALVTAHIPLSQVAGTLRIDEIIRVGRLLAGFLQKRGVAHPRIAVAGLNPHAGENGDLGSEEITIIRPAVDLLSTDATGATFSGPHAPDTVFHQALAHEFDGVLCMYHDQGLIPLKLHAFDQGVNVTLGLPTPRTSPDHGTAFAIAGKGIARPDSTIAAIQLAIELVKR